MFLCRFQIFMLLCGFPPLHAWHGTWVTAETWTSFLIYVGDSRLLTLMGFLWFYMLKCSCFVTILKLRGKGWLGEWDPEVSEPAAFTSLCFFSHSTRAHKRFSVAPPGILPLGGRCRFPFVHEVGLRGIERSLFTAGVQLKWLGQELNSHLFTLDHVLLASSVCVCVQLHVCGKKICI